MGTFALILLILFVIFLIFAYHIYTTKAPGETIWGKFRSMIPFGSS